MNLRHARPDDLPALNRLIMNSKAIWDYDPDFLDACRAPLRVTVEHLSASTVLVAEDEAVGLLGVVQVEVSKKTAELDKLFISPAAIGKGVGRILFQHAADLVHRAGATEICLDADPNAVPFYRHMGMRIIGESPSEALPGRSLPRMALTLSERRADA